MYDEILLNLDNPRRLEQLYHTDKTTFRTAFETLYPQVQANLVAEAWHQRLTYTPDGLHWGSSRDRLFVLAACGLAAVLVKLPAILSLSTDRFYSRNVGFIVFPLLMAWFARKRSLTRRTGMWLTGLVVLAIGYINVLPQPEGNDTLILACLHMPLWLWSLLGFTFVGGRLRRDTNWLGFLRYNGDLAVMTALLLLAGGLTTGLTIGLFALIGWHVEPFFANYIVVCGLAMVPVVATFLTQVQPMLVDKIAPVIARLFTPAVLVILLVYLVAMMTSGKDLYHDRDFLLLFNALLIGVMALVFFSVAEARDGRPHLVQTLVLALLAIITILVNVIALSAILFRIAEWGITPNRIAVLGSNLLIVSHLIVVSTRLWQCIFRQTDLLPISQSMTFFLPAYSIWSALVTFTFPLLFGFR